MPAGLAEVSVVSTHQEHDVRIRGDPAVHRRVRVDLTGMPKTLPTAHNNTTNTSADRVEPRYQTFSRSQAPCTGSYYALPALRLSSSRPVCGKCRWVVAHGTGWAQTCGFSLRSASERSRWAAPTTSCRAISGSAISGVARGKGPTTPTVVTPRDGPGMEYGIAESHSL